MIVSGTIHSTLKIKGNTLAGEQITALLENKRVIGPKKDIAEVLNAIKIYEHLEQYNPTNKNLAWRPPLKKYEPYN
ncbi:MAG: hypothetical protein NXI00_20360 [Cytophagales bacterium]|nr:hypothetical protein [Cytophagales bacterium]